MLSVKFQINFELNQVIIKVQFLYIVIKQNKLFLNKFKLEQAYQYNNA